VDSPKRVLWLMSRYRSEKTWSLRFLISFSVSISSCSLGSVSENHWRDRGKLPELRKQVEKEPDRKSLIGTIRGRAPGSDKSQRKKWRWRRDYLKNWQEPLSERRGWWTYEMDYSSMCQFYSFALLCLITRQPALASFLAVVISTFALSSLNVAEISLKCSVYAVSLRCQSFVDVGANCHSFVFMRFRHMSITFGR
jgi:hypothetical protein